MPRQIDPIARCLDAYTALTEAEQKAADYLIARVRKGEAIVTAPRRGRPVGSKNKQAAAPLLSAPVLNLREELGKSLDARNAATVEGL